MHPFLQNLAKKLLARFGVYPTRLTGLAALRQLIASLQPLTTECELIRLGPSGDGGYLVPNDLSGLLACFSPGVSHVSLFEQDCADRGLRVFLADKSVKKPRQEHELFHFTRKHVGAVAGQEVMTLDDWVATSLPGSRGELLLQMDIEGSEYETLLAASPALLERFRILVVEFHHLEKLSSEPFFGLARRVFEKLLVSHQVVHLHPNNFCGSEQRGGLEIPRVLEITWLRRDRVLNPRPATSFPHPLDADNDPGQPPLPLPRCWYDAPQPPP